MANDKVIFQGKEIKMKPRIALTDANPDERTEAIYSKLDKLGISSNPSLFRVSKLYLSSTQKNRIGNVRDDVAEYKLRNGKKIKSDIINNYI